MRAESPGFSRGEYVNKAYARTQRDCDWLNADVDKPAQVTWTLKPASLNLDLNGGSVSQNNDLNLDLNGGQVAQNRDLNLDLNGGKVKKQIQP